MNTPVINAVQDAMAFAQFVQRIRMTELAFKAYYLELQSLFPKLPAEQIAVFAFTGNIFGNKPVAIGGGAVDAMIATLITDYNEDDIEVVLPQPIRASRLLKVSAGGG